MDARLKAEQYTAQLFEESKILSQDNSQRAPVLQHVSQNVRRLRNTQDMSQATLAEKSGVSRRMLVAIEAGEKNVSLATLDRVAEALDVAFSDLIQAPELRDPSRINEVAWAGTFPGSRAILLAKATARREVELWEFCLEPGEAYKSEADPDGWSEQVYVVEGNLTISLPERSQPVGPGEFFMFASNQAHSYRNDGQIRVRFVRNVVL